MSEYSTPEERTEMPTDKRMQELRRHGNLYQSVDVNTTTSLASGFFILYFIWSWLYRDTKTYMAQTFRRAGEVEEITGDVIFELFAEVVLLFGPDLLILMVFVAFMASMAVMLQTDFNFKEKWIDIKISQLNPINGVKRIFSINGLTNTIKALVKLAIILPIGYLTLKEFAPNMIMLMHLTVEQVMRFLGLAIFELFCKVLYVLILVAIVDYFWGKFQWLKQNKMTKQEVKDERKSVEGDEESKRKIQARGMQRIIQRIRQSVPQADVVITNPTHYAVALKYDRATMTAPQVVAKGQGFLALRIRELAKEAGVPVLERKPLARALYASTEVGSEIPADLFRAVARVLAYVYKLKHPHRYGQQAR